MINRDVSSIADRAQSIKRPIEEARHLPGEVYASEDVFNLEIKNIFKKEWFIVSREEEISKIGDYCTFKIFGEPILICRDKEYNVQAFYNNCRHRGVEVASRNGNSKTFMCPYHGWIYDLQGRLLDAPMMNFDKDFDAANCRLPVIRVETWGGFIFINFDPNAKSLQEELGEHLGRIDFLQSESCRIVDSYTVDVDCNWKLLVENLMDAYHLGVLHVDTLGRDWDPSMVKFDLLGNGGSFVVAQIPTMTPDGISLFGNMPWLKDADPKFATGLTLPPNAIIFSRCDLMTVFLALPVSASKTQLTGLMLMPESVLVDPDFETKIKIYRDFGQAIFAEDGEMLISLQHTFSTEAYRPGPLNKLEEGIKHYLASYVDRVFDLENLSA